MKKLDLARLKGTIAGDDSNRWPWSMILKLIDYTSELESIAVSAAAAARKAGHNVVANEVIDHIERGVVL